MDYRKIIFKEQVSILHDIERSQGSSSSVSKMYRHLKYKIINRNPVICIHKISPLKSFHTYAAYNKYDFS